MAVRPPLRYFRRVALVVLALGGVTAGGGVRAGEMVLVATAAMDPYVAVLSERLRTRMPDPPLVETAENAHAAVDRFCAPGAAAQVYGLVLHRPLNRRERAQCRDVGVEPSAIALGVEAAVVAVPRSSPVSHLSLDTLFAAVVRDLPREGRLHANASQSWRDVDVTLPDQAIAVLLPAEPAAARLLVDDRGLQGACRKQPETQAIYSAGERSRRCTALRGDDLVREYDGGAALDQALAQPAPGLVAVVSVAAFTARQDRLTALPLEGVAPDDSGISGEDYPLARRVYLYLRQPEPRRLGAADRHRLAMLADLASHEEAVGPGGAFAAAGLVPLPLQVRADQRVEVLHRLTGGWP